MFIDLGGSKNAATVNGKWKIMDIFKEADIIYDITSGKNFPLLDNSIDAFYSSHTFEHASYEKVDLLLDEMFRTLKPGGKVRIVVPDYDIAIHCYINKIPFPQNFPSGGSNKYQITRLHAFGNSPDKFLDKDGKIKNYNDLGANYVAKNTLSLKSSGHTSIFNFQYLYEKMRERNFKNIIRKAWGDQSKIFDHKEDGYYERYSNFSIYLEAEK